MEHREPPRASSLNFPTPSSSRSPSPSPSVSEPTVDFDAPTAAPDYFDPPRASRAESKYRTPRPHRTLDRLPRGFVWADDPHDPDDRAAPPEPVAPRSAAAPGAPTDANAVVLAKAAASARWGHVRVPENTRYVVERAGTYHRVLEPGLRMIVPGLDRVAYVFSKKMQKLAFSTAHVPTTDRVPVTVRGVLFYVVDEPIAAAYAVEDVCTALVDLAAAAVHNEFARRSVDTLFRDLSHVWARVAQQVNEASHVWGVRALSFSSQVVLPPAIARAYERLTRARMQQRITDARATADARRRERRSEARAREIQVAAEGRVLVLSGDAQAESEAILMKGDANATALSAIAEALDRPSGRDAARVWIASRYLDALSIGLRANHPTVTLDPSGPSHMVDQALNIMDTQHLRSAPASAATPTDHSVAAATSSAPEPAPVRAATSGASSDAKTKMPRSPLEVPRSRPRRLPRPHTPANIALKPPTRLEPLQIPEPLIIGEPLDTESPVTPFGPIPPFQREHATDQTALEAVEKRTETTRSSRLKHLPRSRRRRSVDTLEPLLGSLALSGGRSFVKSVDGSEGGPSRRSRDSFKSGSSRPLLPAVPTLPRPQRSRISTRSSSRRSSRSSGGGDGAANSKAINVEEEVEVSVAVEYAGDAEDDGGEAAATSGAESGADAFAAGFELRDAALWTSNLSEQDEGASGSQQEGISLEISASDVRAELASPTALGTWARRPRRTAAHAPRHSVDAPGVSEKADSKAAIAAQPLLSPHASSMTAGEEDERDEIVAAPMDGVRARRSKHTLEFRRRRGGGGSGRRSRASLDGGVGGTTREI